MRSLKRTETMFTLHRYDFNLIQSCFGLRVLTIFWEKIFCSLQKVLQISRNGDNVKPIQYTFCYGVSDFLKRGANL